MSKQKRYREDIPTDAPIWAQRINRRLIDVDMTQEELAANSGVSKATITGWIKGDKTGRVTEPKAQGLIAVAKALDVSTDYLLGLSDHENQDVIDGLIKKVHELDGLDTKHKSLLLWSLGFVSERLKQTMNDELKNKVVSWLAVLLQCYAGMIYLPEKLKFDSLTLATLTSNHRESIHCLNELDAAISEEIYKRHM
ncbi:MAG: helix-turn-helix domain-containing protein [Oscillospiraceae bacterium]|jgi:transcriptional regulator with XRE-family HTH domain|nr:helix-turn-helix domain-containing protein [Oscillospiraceae bacterium]